MSRSANPCAGQRGPLPRSVHRAGFQPEPHPRFAWWVSGALDDLVRSLSMLDADFILHRYRPRRYVRAVRQFLAAPEQRPEPAGELP